MEDNQLLYLGQYERKQKQLADLRKKECIEYSEQSTRPKTRKPLPIDGRGMLLPLGTYERTRKNLQEERKRDFKVFIKQNPSRPRHVAMSTGAEGSLLPLGQYESVHRKLQEERYKEFKEFAKKQKQQISEEQLRSFRAQQRASEPPRREPQDKGDNPHGFVDNLGAYDRERNLINQERQRDYNLFLDQKFSSNSKPHGRPNFVKGKEIQESNDLHMERQHYYRNPGGHSGPSRAPQKAISSVSQTYAELLQQKRRQEACYRQNDPSYQRSDEMPDMQQSTASFPRTEAHY